MLRSTIISIGSAISSPAKLTNKDEPARWPSGAPSRPDGRWGLGVLRATQTSGRYSDKAFSTKPGRGEETAAAGSRRSGAQVEFDLRSFLASLPPFRRCFQGKM